MSSGVGRSIHPPGTRTNYVVFLGTPLRGSLKVPYKPFGEVIVNFPNLMLNVS